MEETRRQARRAGVLYLLIGVIAPIGLIVVPDAVMVRGDAAATAARVRDSASLVRLGIASELVHQIIGILLVLALYRLFQGVNERHARLMVIFSLLAVPIVFVNVLTELAALLFARGADFLSVFDQGQRDALAFLSLRLHAQGINVASIFWGLWLFPFGILVIRSRFIPRVLGLLLMIAGVGYLASALTSLLLPQYAAAVGRVALALEFGELPIVFWLLIWGAKPQGSPSASVAPAGG